MQIVIDAIDAELLRIANERELARVASVEAQATTDATNGAFLAIDARWQALQKARKLLREAAT